MTTAVLARPEAARFPVAGHALTAGFATAAGMWCIAFLTHMPGMNLPPAIPVFVLIFGALAGGAAAGLAGPRRLAPHLGLMSGFIASAVNLLTLGTFLPEYVHADQATRLGELNPSAWVIVTGFLTFGAVVGLAGGTLSLIVPRTADAQQPGVWVSRFAVVASVAMAPLLLIGGLVTSAEAGMAVPDWPGTYGANMFLFPISKMMAQERVFLEHTHRLFGSLVGLTILTLMLVVLFTERRRWVRGFAIGLFLLVAVQGILGGIRVEANSVLLATVHGVTGQVALAATVGLSACLSPTFRASEPATLDSSAHTVRMLGVGVVLVTVAQLTLGATYRHVGSLIALLAHILGAIIVTTLAAAIGFSLTRNPPRTPSDATLFRIGRSLVITVGLQVLLGIGALWVVLANYDGSRPPLSGELETTPPVPPIETYVATAHQALGALVLVLGVLAATWSFRLLSPPGTQS